MTELLAAIQTAWTAAGSLSGVPLWTDELPASGDSAAPAAGTTYAILRDNQGGRVMWHFGGTSIEPYSIQFSIFATTKAAASTVAQTVAGVFDNNTISLSPSANLCIAFLRKYPVRSFLDQPAQRDANAKQIWHSPLIYDVLVQPR